MDAETKDTRWRADALSPHVGRSLRLIVKLAEGGRLDDRPEQVFSGLALVVFNGSDLQYCGKHIHQFSGTVINGALAALGDRRSTDNDGDPHTHNLQNTVYAAKEPDFNTTGETDIGYGADACIFLDSVIAANP